MQENIQTHLRKDSGEGLTNVTHVSLWASTPCYCVHTCEYAHVHVTHTCAPIQRNNQTRLYRRDSGNFHILDLQCGLNFEWEGTRVSTQVLWAFLPTSLSIINWPTVATQGSPKPCELSPAKIFSQWVKASSPVTALSQIHLSQFHGPFSAYQALSGELRIFLSGALDVALLPHCLECTEDQAGRCPVHWAHREPSR